eukprot:4664568-Alexandrium_andersonii.AAC.1
MSASLVGSEMCIRDSSAHRRGLATHRDQVRGRGARAAHRPSRSSAAVSYTHLTLPTICSV